MGKPSWQETKRFRSVKAEALTPHFAALDKLFGEHGINSSRLFNHNEVRLSPGENTYDSLACKRLIHKNNVQAFLCTVVSLYKNFQQRNILIIRIQGMSPMLVTRKMGSKLEVICSVVI